MTEAVDNGGLERSSPLIGVTRAAALSSPIVINTRLVSSLHSLLTTASEPKSRSLHCFLNSVIVMMR